MNFLQLLPRLGMLSAESRYDAGRAGKFVGEFPKGATEHAAPGTPEKDLYRKLRPGIIYLSGLGNSKSHFELDPLINIRVTTSK